MTDEVNLSGQSQRNKMHPMRKEINAPEHTIVFREHQRLFEVHCSLETQDQKCIF